jgi:predicted secreted hydrolase
MAAEGDMTWHGRTEHFTGSAWMDREFGTWRTTENQRDGIGSAFNSKPARK